MHIITFLKENWLNLALVVVGASAIIVYLLQKRSEERAAATKVILQIDQIEKNIALSTAVSWETICQTVNLRLPIGDLLTMRKC